MNIQAVNCRTWIIQPTWKRIPEEPVSSAQWEFQDPKMEVLYGTVPYKPMFGVYIPLHSACIGVIYW